MSETCEAFPAESPLLSARGGCLRQDACWSPKTRGVPFADSVQNYCFESADGTLKQLVSGYKLCVMSTTFVYGGSETVSNKESIRTHTYLPVPRLYPVPTMREF